MLGSVVGRLVVLFSILNFRPFQISEDAEGDIMVCPCLVSWLWLR